MPIQKHIFILFTFVFSTVIANAELSLAAVPAGKNDSVKTAYSSPNHVQLTDSVINYGKLFLNTPYRYGSSGDSSFDCSGFTSYVYRNFGYDLQRSSADQAQQFDTVDRSSLKPGDLVFFSGRRKSRNVGHVGIVVNTKEDGKFDFIHASVQRGVTISNSDEAYYAKRFIKACRVIGENLLLGVAPAMATGKNAPKFNSMPVPAPVTKNKPIKSVIPAEYHRVKSGETLSSISKAYGVSVDDLREMNRLKGNKISLKQNLKIRPEKEVIENRSANVTSKANPGKTDMVDIAKTDANKPEETHIVKKGETLFSIARDNKLSVNELKKINRLNDTKVHVGQEIKLEKTAVEVAVKPESTPKTKTHKVKQGESLFSIAKANNLTVDELKNMNNLSSTKLSLGQEIVIGTSTKGASNNKSEKASQINHKVSPGESFYSIAKKYGCTVNDLKDWNNKSDNNVQVGENIIVRR